MNLLSNLKLPGGSTELIRNRARFLLLLSFVLGLSTIGASSAHAESSSHCELGSGPGTVFATIEAAARDALGHAHVHARIADRRRLRIGTIRRSGAGYTYGEPRRSLGSSDSRLPPVVRHSLGPEDVATYVVHPRTGHRRVDRLNERPNESERRIVDELDRAHRPLFVLTPSLRVVRYRKGGEVRALADLKAPDPVPVIQTLASDPARNTEPGAAPVSSSRSMVWMPPTRTAR